MTRALITLLLLIACEAIGQVFTWTDENGVTHYGDKVPSQYKSDSRSVEVKTKRIGTVKAPEFKAYSSDENKTITELNAKQVKHTSTCSTAWAKYKSSQSCIEACGTDTFTYSGSGIGRNHDCGCIKVKRPRCRLEQN